MHCRETASISHARLIEAPLAKFVYAKNWPPIGVAHLSLTQSLGCLNQVYKLLRLPHSENYFTFSLIDPVSHVLMQYWFTYSSSGMIYNFDRKTLSLLIYQMIARDSFTQLGCVVYSRLLSREFEAFCTCLSD